MRTTIAFPIQSQQLSFKGLNKMIVKSKRGRMVHWGRFVIVLGIALGWTSLEANDVSQINYACENDLCSRNGYSVSPYLGNGFSGNKMIEGVLLTPESRLYEQTSGTGPLSCGIESDPVNCDAPTVLNHGSIGPVYTTNPSGLYGGIEFVWMRANFDQNVAMVVDPPIGNRLVPFDYSLQMTPRAQLGWQSSSGSGFRSTYWQFDAEADTEVETAVVGATPVYLFVYGAGNNLTRNAYADLGETLVSNHSLKMHTLDFEITEAFRLTSLRLLGGVGLRYGKMEQHLRGDVYDAGGVLEEAVTNDLGFEGVGPTASLQTLRPLGQSRWGLFSNMRGSLLMSETTQSIYEMKNAGADELVDLAEQREVITQIELGLGLQYHVPLSQRALLVARCNYECQVWFDAGGPVDSHSTISLDGIALAMGLQF